MNFIPAARIAFVLLPLAACAGSMESAERTANASAAAQGQALAEQHCAACHAIGPTGDSPAPMAPVWREYVMVNDVDGLDEFFAEGTFVHSDGPVQMPEFMLSPIQIDALLAYMKSLRPA